MSVLVKGMEMPKCCAGCDAEEYYENSYGDECGFFCPFGDKAYTSETRELKRLDDCPIIPIPPHGRLIDADAVFDNLERTGWYDNADRDIAEDLVLDAPTVIPAEPPKEET